MSIIFLRRPSFLYLVPKILFFLCAYRKKQEPFPRERFLFYDLSDVYQIA